MDEIRNRMPVALELDDVDTWLSVDEHPPDERALLRRPALNGTLSGHGVGLDVGNVKNDGPHLVEPFRILCKYASPVMQQHWSWRPTTPQRLVRVPLE
jgi:putative SOS response-associated peptidase YedK